MRSSTPRSSPRRAAGDAGSASVELAILFPVLLLVVTAVVQAGLWFHARSVALAAAQEGATAARAYGAEPSAGVARARDFVADHGGGTLLDATATPVTAAPGVVGVVVTGRALSILPGVPALEVSQHAQGPLERFTEVGSP